MEINCTLMNTDEKLERLLIERDRLVLSKSNYELLEFNKLYKNLNSKIWRLKNPDKSRSSVNNWRLKNLQYKRLANINWIKNNPDKAKISSDKWVSNNLEKYNEILKNYRSINWELYYVSNIEKKELLKNIKTSIKNQDLTNIIDKFKGECYNCGVIRDLCFDHFYPLRYKVPLSTENCTVLCRVCNGKKGQKDPEDFFSKKQIKDLVNNYGIKLIKKRT